MNVKSINKDNSVTLRMDARDLHNLLDLQIQQYNDRYWDCLENDENHMADFYRNEAKKLEAIKEQTKEAERASFHALLNS